jgi:GDP-L-fucose synthase
MQKDSRVYVAGHRGLVGSAIVRALEGDGHTNLILRTRSELDLIDQVDVEMFFREQKPEYVFLAAAKVGGIRANNERPAEFIFENLQIQTNIIHMAWRHGVKKLVFLGSSCIYPNTAWHAITENELLSGGLEPTNQWYAIAKIAGIKMCHAYRRQFGFNSICVMPTNLYGPNDNYDTFSSHVLPAMIRRFHDAKESSLPSVQCWGDGSPRREFLHSDDLAQACVKLMHEYDDEQIINIGSSHDHTIKEIAEVVADIVGYKGHIEWDGDVTRNGTRRKLICSRRIRALGWEPKIGLIKGLEDTYRDFLAHVVQPERERVAA